MKFKDEGNKLFKSNSPQDAKDMYTKALMYCPFNENDLKSNKDYAIILANRSAALENLSCHEGVAEDIDLALKYGYPRELYFKVCCFQTQKFPTRYKISQKLFSIFLLRFTIEKDQPCLDENYSRIPKLPFNYVKTSLANPI